MASTIEVDQVKHSGGVAFTLPTADGSAGQKLKTDGSGVLSFVSDTDSGITSLAADTTPQLGGDLDLNSNNITGTGNIPAANLTGTLPAISGASLTGLPAVHRNDIINGGLVVNQENNTAPADDAYTIGDLFLHVGEGTPVMSLETDGPQGTRPWQKMVLDANAQGGLVYFMSNADCQDYIANGKLSFGIQLKTTAATISNARIGILKWVGTADAVTSDVVGTWASDGTNPTLATSWSYENTPANIALTTSWARHTVEDVTVDSDATNLAIFIWTDDGTITASDVIGFSEWQCNPGSTVNDFSQLDEGSVRQRSEYYLEKMQDSSNIMAWGVGFAFTTTNCQIFVPYGSPKRIAPTITIATVSGGDWEGLFNGVGRVPSAIGVSQISETRCKFTGVFSGMTAGEPMQLADNGGKETFLLLDARL